MPRDIRVYLADILESIGLIRSYVPGMNFEEFKSDRKTYDAVLRNLEIIGEAVKHLPPEVRDKRPEVEWKVISALRDILAHEYFGVRPDIVWDIVTTKLSELEKEIDILIELLPPGAEKD